jgi:hypothetical protein
LKRGLWCSMQPAGMSPRQGTSFLCCAKERRQRKAPMRPGPRGLGQKRHCSYLGDPLEHFAGRAVIRRPGIPAGLRSENSSRQRFVETTANERRARWGSVLQRSAVMVLAAKSGPYSGRRITARRGQAEKGSCHCERCRFWPRPLGPGRIERLSFAHFSLARQRKVGRRPGRNPGGLSHIAPA